MTYSTICIFKWILMWFALVSWRKRPGHMAFGSHSTKYWTPHIAGDLSLLVQWTDCFSNSGLPPRSQGTSTSLSSQLSSDRHNTLLPWKLERFSQCLISQTIKLNLNWYQFSSGFSLIAAEDALGCFVLTPKKTPEWCMEETHGVACTRATFPLLLIMWP